METLQARLAPYSQQSATKQPTSKQPATNRTTEPQSKPNKTKEQRLRYLLAMIDFLSATEPFFQREFEQCAAAIRRKAYRTPDDDLTAIINVLGDGGLTTDDIVAETGLCYQTTYALLRRLEVAGLVNQTALCVRGERTGRGGVSKRLIWWLRGHAPKAYRVRRKAAKMPKMS